MSVWPWNWLKLSWHQRCRVCCAGLPWTLCWVCGVSWTWSGRYYPWPRSVERPNVPPSTRPTEPPTAGWSPIPAVGNSCPTNTHTQTQSKHQRILNQKWPSPTVSILFNLLSRRTNESPLASLCSVVLLCVVGLWCIVWRKVIITVTAGNRHLLMSEDVFRGWLFNVKDVETIAYVLLLFFKSLQLGTQLWHLLQCRIWGYTATKWTCIYIYTQIRP